MNEIHRNMVKWQPFNSLINSKELLNGILKEKRKVKKPNLSEEDITNMENKIIDAYFMQNTINITYYQNGNLLKVKSKIKKIDQVYKMIYLDNLRLLFNQIIAIELE